MMKVKINYKTDNMKKCEYIEAMKKTYFEAPVQNEKCEGFKNRYTGDVSLVCAICKNFNGG